MTWINLNPIGNRFSFVVARIQFLRRQIGRGDSMKGQLTSVMTRLQLRVLCTWYCEEQLCFVIYPPSLALVQLTQRVPVRAERKLRCLSIFGSCQMHPSTVFWLGATACTFCLDKSGTHGAMDPQPWSTFFGVLLLLNMLPSTCKATGAMTLPDSLFYSRWQLIASHHVVGQCRLHAPQRG